MACRQLNWHLLPTEKLGPQGRKRAFVHEIELAARSAARAAIQCNGGIILSGIYHLMGFAI
jgi:hypothetical protein